MSTVRITVILFCLACLLPTTSFAADCDQTALKDEHKDAATLQRLELAWSDAFTKGDMDFERCLLTPDFTEITRTGLVKQRTNWPWRPRIGARTCRPRRRSRSRC
jgi:hypothetical protein